MKERLSSDLTEKKRNQAEEKDNVDDDDNNVTIFISLSLSLLRQKHYKPLEDFSITIISRRLVFCLYCFMSNT